MHPTTLERPTKGLEQMVDQAQHTRAAHTLRHMSEGWHLLHTIHRQLTRLREGGPLTRDYCVESIRHNARSLYFKAGKGTLSPGIVQHSGILARHLAACIHQLDPPATNEEIRELQSSYRELVSIACRGHHGETPVETLRRQGHLDGDGELRLRFGDGETP